MALAGTQIGDQIMTPFLRPGFELLRTIVYRFVARTSRLMSASTLVNRQAFS